MKWMIWGKSTTILGTPHMKRIWNFLSYPLLKASTSNNSTTVTVWEKVYRRCLSPRRFLGIWISWKPGSLFVLGKIVLRLSWLFFWGDGENCLCVWVGLFLTPTLVLRIDRSCKVMFLFCHLKIWLMSRLDLGWRILLPWHASQFAEEKKHVCNLRHNKELWVIFTRNSESVLSTVQSKDPSGTPCIS